TRARVAVPNVSRREAKDRGTAAGRAHRPVRVQGGWRQVRVRVGGRIDRLQAQIRRGFRGGCAGLRRGFGVMPAGRGGGSASLPARIARMPAAIALLGVLLLTLWPHWVWMARRLTDGSDEPWGVLALVTVLVLVAREWRALAPPSRGALYAVALLAVAAGA